MISIGQHGDEINNKNGVEMLEFFKRNEMRTLNKVYI